MLHLVILLRTPTARPTPKNVTYYLNGPLMPQLSLKVMFVLEVVKRNQKTIILPHKYKSVTFWSFCIVC